MRDHMVKVKHRVRYPPFESSKMNPEEIPIAENSFELEGNVVPPFKLGSENSWLVERIVEGDYQFDSDYHGEIPTAIEKQRTGWYILPNPIHSKARKFINIAVVIMMTALFYLFTAPLQGSLGIPTFGTGKIRLGLLDYPVLAVFIVPLLITPIVLRVAANLSDLTRQKEFLSNAPKSPKLEFYEIQNDSNLKGKVIFDQLPMETKSMKITWRVGVLPPARHRLFAALNLDPNGQPPPGLTTALPHHWEEGLDDGTGMGEDAPMERHDVPGGMFLRPMRIMSTGSVDEITQDDSEFTLDPPEGEWPGTVYGDLIRVHWECIITFERESGGPLMWVQPLIVSHSDNEIVNPNLIIQDGRTESDIL